MEFYIERKGESVGPYSKEDIQAMINYGTLIPSNLIWSQEYVNWKTLSETDFKFNIDYTPNNIFFNLFSPYFKYIDIGDFFKVPLRWLYILFAILNLCAPLILLFTAIDGNFFNNLSVDMIILFILLFLIFSFAGWLCFQLWWDRKDSILSISNQNDEFIATPALSHLVQSLGEWFGTWLAINGTLVSIVFFIFSFIGNSEYENVSYMIRDFIPLISIGWRGIILFPIVGYLIIISTRFLSEQIKAFSAIANNTKKEQINS